MLVVKRWAVEKLHLDSASDIEMLVSYDGKTLVLDDHLTMESLVADLWDPSQELVLYYRIRRAYLNQPPPFVQQLL
jgi:hypothetical protein